jgi:hypothetical protein
MTRAAVADPHDRIHPDAEGTGCLFLLLSGVVALGLLALAYHWLTR